MRVYARVCAGERALPLAVYRVSVTRLSQH